MGVWIEIFDISCGHKLTIVTPLVGVWIEIRLKQKGKIWKKKSLPLWECGLKLFDSATFADSYTVTPLVGVWIEITTPFALQ